MTFEDEVPALLADAPHPRIPRRSCTIPVEDLEDGRRDANQAVAIDNYLPESFAKH